MIEVHYGTREDPSSIPKKNFNWEDKLNYIKKRLVSFSNNKEEGYPWKIKWSNNKKLIFYHIYFQVY